MPPPAIRVDRARLAHARPGDRERLTRAFDLASPAATGVSERALLLIPRMRVERPLGGGVESFANELIDRIRAAKVAARCGGSNDAQGAYFEDEIALEIAIVRAWLAGAPLPQALREAVPLAATPVSRWRQHLFSDHRKVPRLIAALVEANLAGAWLARFSEDELVAAADGLVRTHGGIMPRMGAEPRRLHSLARREGKAVEGGTGPPAVVSEIVGLARTTVPNPGARAFLAVALLAARQPALVPTRVFAAALVELSSETVMPARRQVRRQRKGGLPSPEMEIRSRTIAKPSAPEAGPARGNPSQMRMPMVDPSIAMNALVPRQSRSPARESPRPADTVLPLPAPGETRAITSAHAGLFFLLNTFLALGLYGDFTDPVRRLRGLSPFELLLLLGRRWIGLDLERDPIAPMLRALAGLAPRARPGRYFEAKAWQVPEDWLAPWPRGRPGTIRSRFGTSRWHPAGFPIADRWRTPSTATWLRRRWVACLARYIEARLMRALDADNGREALSIVLAQRGTIRVDDERVEVAFALDAHPLAIRMAGLDRDPGWVPAAGRSIGFRFT